MDTSKRAKVLVQAMPYIKKYAGETIVVKYGGNAMINEELKSAVMSDLVLMQLVGINVVLVHGGGPEISQMLKKTGKESKFIIELNILHHALEVFLDGNIGSEVAVFFKLV